MSGIPRHLRHGHSALKTHTYRIWQAMRDRCSNPNNPKWAYYGGRGIRVCKRWSNYVNFLADMGERPPGLTLERVNRNGNYTPSNCKWVTWFEQNTNRSNTLTWEDVDTIRATKGRTLQSLADEYGVHQSTIGLIRLNKTWKLHQRTHS